MIATLFLMLLAVYLISGFAFAIPFVIAGVGKMDPHANHGSWGFRILIIPGSVMLWPLLARRWIGGIHEPPEERNAHRNRSHRRGEAEPSPSPL